MIKLKLDWREVLWWMQGGMAGSHLRWSVYEDMVDKVWIQCTDLERYNLFVIMRRDLGSHWRPDEWNGLRYQYAQCKGEGPWLPEEKISDKTPWMYFRQVLARFDPDNQYTVSVAVGKEKVDTGGKLRAYLWQGHYYVGWSTYVNDDAILGVARTDIPDGWMV